MDAPAVSVLLPCYNAANTLEEALASLAAQSWRDFEVVAVDDGSSDDSAHILAAWAESDPRFRLIRRPHEGIIAALTAGLAACRAELVARMDADDRSHPERLALQIELLRAQPELAVAGCLVAGYPSQHMQEGYRIYIEWLNSLVSDEDIRREIFVESPLAHPSVMFRKGWVAQVGGYQEHGWPEDYDLWLRLYLAGAHFAKVLQVLLDWRESPQRLTRVDSRYSLENFLRAKACYLVHGPLQNRESVIIWGAGMMGRRLGRQLQRLQAPLVAFVDIDARKIGRTRLGLPIIAPQELAQCWQQSPAPVILAAVGARGARRLIRTQLTAMGLRESLDWWAAA